MTGHDIINAMRHAYGLGPDDDSRDIETFSMSDGLTRLQRFLIVMMIAMRGGLS